MAAARVIYLYVSTRTTEYMRFVRWEGVEAVARAATDTHKKTKKIRHVEMCVRSRCTHNVLMTDKRGIWGSIVNNTTPDHHRKCS